MYKRQDKLSDTPLPADHEACVAAEADVAARTKRFLDTNGSRSVDWFHRELGKIVWDRIGMARTKAGLEAAVEEIPALRQEFHEDVRVLGSGESLNSSLEKAGRVSDFFELAELMAHDALTREESAGGHFREESQTDEGEALRDDDNFSHVAAWEWGGDASKPIRHTEQLDFEHVALTQRSYK